MHDVIAIPIVTQFIIRNICILQICKTITTSFVRVLLEDKYCVKHLSKKFQSTSLKAFPCPSLFYLEKILNYGSRRNPRPKCAIMLIIFLAKASTIEI